MNADKTILITGAGGYIASVATYLLLQEGYRVVAIDNFTTGYREPLEILQEKFGKENLTFYEISTTDPKLDQIFKNHQIDAVMHYAASCSVNESMEKPEKYFTNNVCGTQNLLSTMLSHNVKTIVFSSTSEVYGEAQYMPIDESHPLNPTNPYGLSKRIAEQMIEWYGQLKDLHYVVLRYFNVCGASDDGVIGDSKKPSILLMQNAVRGALGIEKFYLTCPTVDTPDGTPIRDYINVVDLNVAHSKALKYLFNGGHSEFINLGTGTGNSVLEIVQTVEQITGADIPKEKGEARKGEPTKKVANIRKARDVLGWEPTHSLTDSVNSLVKWYTAKPKGYAK